MKNAGVRKPPRVSEWFLVARSAKSRSGGTQIASRPISRYPFCAGGLSNRGIREGRCLQILKNENGAFWARRRRRADGEKSTPRYRSDRVCLRVQTATGPRICNLRTRGRNTPRRVRKPAAYDGERLFLLHDGVAVAVAVAVTVVGPRARKHYRARRRRRL